MPVYNWTRVDAGIFHHFHQDWIAAICRRLNSGLLPLYYYALIEQETGEDGLDVRTLKSLPRTKSALVDESSYLPYLKKQNIVVVRHVPDDEPVAVLLILSRGNKSSRLALQAVLDNVLALVHARIHVLLVDLFPPTSRDPFGVHSALWEEAKGIHFEPPADKPLTLAVYEAGEELGAFGVPIAVGDVLPAMPLLLRQGATVAVPLGETYASTWRGMPHRWREVLERG